MAGMLTAIEHRHVSAEPLFNLLVASMVLRLAFQFGDVEETVSSQRQEQPDEHLAKAVANTKAAKATPPILVQKSRAVSWPRNRWAALVRALRAVGIGYPRQPQQELPRGPVTP
jgi:hypothetical protein